MHHQQTTLRIGGQQQPVPGRKLTPPPGGDRKMQEPLRADPEHAAGVRAHGDQATADANVEPLATGPAQRRHDHPIGDAAAIVQAARMTGRLTSRPTRLGSALEYTHRMTRRNLERRRPLAMSR